MPPKSETQNSSSAAHNIQSEEVLQKLIYYLLMYETLFLCLLWLLFEPYMSQEYDKSSSSSKKKGQGETILIWMCIIQNTEQHINKTHKRSPSEPPTTQHDIKKSQPTTKARKNNVFYSGKQVIFLSKVIQFLCFLVIVPRKAPTNWTANPKQRQLRFSNKFTRVFLITKYIFDSLARDFLC